MNSKIKNKLLAITLLPLVIIGITTIVVTITQMISYNKESTLSQLSATANTVNTSLKQLYGEYDEKKDDSGCDSLAIGDTVINGRVEYLDLLKEETGLEYSLFYGSTRVATTVKNSNGEYALGTTIDEETYRAIKNEDVVYSISIGDNKYSAYYLPILNNSGKNIGLLGVAFLSSGDAARKFNTIIPILGCIVILLAITIFLILSYAKDITDCISSIRDFVNNIANEKFNKRLSDKVYERNDELGEIGRDITIMRNTLRDMVEKDALTELYNKRTGNKKLEAIRSKCRANKRPYCLAIGDIDFFKKVNDTYGHDAGDIVLKEVAAILRKNMKGNGFVARWGGEEFMLGFENMSLQKAGKLLLKALNEIRRNTVEYNGMIIDVTMTFGLVCGTEARNLEDLFKIADNRLYRGKEGGRNQIVSGTDDVS